MTGMICALKASVQSPEDLLLSLARRERQKVFRNSWLWDGSVLRIDY